MASIANMVLPSNALLSVEAWANTEFPRFYAPLYNNKNPQDVQLRTYAGYERGGNVQQQPVSIFAVLVGEMDDEVSVISRLAHNGQVELYYERKYTTGQVIVVPVEDVKKIQFYSPFNHPVDANSPASINRVECLIRWTYLVGGLPHAIQDCQEYFKVHFRDACRDVARAEGAVTDDDDAGADNNSPANTPPDLISDTDVTGLNGARGATSFNKLARSLDDTYHDFKTRIFQQINEAKRADAKRIKDLADKCQKHESIIASLDEDLEEVTKELEETKSKLQAAEQALAAQRVNT